MGRLRIKATECKHRESTRMLKEQFINSMNYEVMTADIIKELTALKDTAKLKSKQILIWAKRVEAQRLQTVMLESI